MDQLKEGALSHMNPLGNRAAGDCERVNTTPTTSGCLIYLPELSLTSKRRSLNKRCYRRQASQREVPDGTALPLERAQGQPHHRTRRGSSLELWLSHSWFW